MKLSYLIRPSKYIKKIKSINNYIKKSKIIKSLIKSDILSIPLTNIWEIEKNNFITKVPSNISEYNIFGIPLNLNNINWHKDYVSGFKYPLERFDKIKISKWFDKGIDVKFPWEMSRFYFAIRLAQNYVITKDEKYYLKFKELILDWIEKNQFCYGVNWVCTMEVAIRAINWIVAINIFGKEDDKFEKIMSKSLIQHAEYIALFPEIYHLNGKQHTGNHTTACYAGLVFLAITLKQYSKSEKWLEQAINGLEDCIKYQTYEDGVNFEASIPYHRLVLEMFAFSAVVCRANNIDLSNKYYELLFKMFEYTAAYMDHDGNAPQIGDNDSGRIFIFHDSNEHDHSYLIDLGEHIFDYKFKSNNLNRSNQIKNWLPEIKKIALKELSLFPRITNKSISFYNGGAHILKRDYLFVFIGLFPLGQNGLGGHNHYDTGSFTLSYKGIPIIVDPGTYSYTKDLKLREKFRSYNSHNTLFVRTDRKIEKSRDEIWRLTNKFFNNVIDVNETSLIVKIDLHRKNIRYRKYKLYNNYLNIIDTYKGDFFTLIHFAPLIDLIPKSESIINFRYGSILLNKGCEYKIETYDYSYSYGLKQKALCLIINNSERINVKINFMS